MLDPAQVQAAVKEHEAVLCTLGDGSKGQVRFEGTRNIVRAMEAEGVKRLICQSTLGAGESRGNLNFFWRQVMFALLLRKALRDHERQEAFVRGSCLAWTIVRPAAFTNGKVTGLYRHGFAPTNRTLALKVSRADVALFMLMQLGAVQPSSPSWTSLEPIATKIRSKEYPPFSALDEVFARLLALRDNKEKCFRRGPGPSATYSAPSLNR